MADQGVQPLQVFGDAVAMRRGLKDAGTKIHELEGADRRPQGSASLREQLPLDAEGKAKFVNVRDVLVVVISKFLETLSISGSFIFKGLLGPSIFKFGEASTSFLVRLYRLRGFLWPPLGALGVPWGRFWLLRGCPSRVPFSRAYWGSRFLSLGGRRRHFLARPYRLRGPLAGWSVGWLFGWVVGWSAGGLAGWRVGWPSDQAKSQNTTR